MSLVWTTVKPTVKGWYWVRERMGAEYIADITLAWFSKPVDWQSIVAFAGPIAEPKEPNKRQLAQTRYKVGGGDGIAYGFFETEWIYSREDMEHCVGRFMGAAGIGQVYVLSSERRGKSWSRESERDYRMTLQGGATVAREVHTLVVAGSTPAPAPNLPAGVQPAGVVEAGLPGSAIAGGPGIAAEGLTPDRREFVLPASVMVSPVCGSGVVPGGGR